MGNYRGVDAEQKGGEGGDSNPRDRIHGPTVFEGSGLDPSNSVWCVWIPFYRVGIPLSGVLSAYGRGVRHEDATRIGVVSVGAG